MLNRGDWKAMLILYCPQCASNRFESIEVEVRISVSSRKNDFMEVRQEEICCLSCQWIPSDDLPDVSVQRKIAHISERKWTEFQRN